MKDSKNRLLVGFFVLKTVQYSHHQFQKAFFEGVGGLFCRDSGGARSDGADEAWQRQFGQHQDQDKSRGLQ